MQVPATAEHTIYSHVKIAAAARFKLIVGHGLLIN